MVGAASSRDLHEWDKSDSRLEAAPTIHHFLHVIVTEFFRILKESISYFLVDAHARGRTIWKIFKKRVGCQSFLWLDSNRSELYGPRSPILTANTPGIHEYSDR